MSFQPSMSSDQFILLFRLPPQREWYVLLTREVGRTSSGEGD